VACSRILASWRSYRLSELATVESGVGEVGVILRFE